MKSMILFCLIGFLVLITTAVRAQDIAINEETTGITVLVSDVQMVNVEVIAPDGTFDAEEDPTCTPCYIVTYFCADCGQSVTSQWCHNCYHGSLGAWGITVCAQKCSQQ